MLAPLTAGKLTGMRTRRPPALLMSPNTTYELEHERLVSKLLRCVWACSSEGMPDEKLVG